MSRSEDLLAKQTLILKEELLTIVQSSIFKSNISAREVARSVGKPYPTLMREVNPYDPGAKLGADTLVQVMQQTKDVAPLEYMAKAVGCRVVPE